MKRSATGVGVCGQCEVWVEVALGSSLRCCDCGGRELRAVSLPASEDGAGIIMGLLAEGVDVAWNPKRKEWFIPEVST